MTAYSPADLDQAFECAARLKLSESVDSVRVRVQAHLNGECKCQLQRCESCGKRVLNGIPRHTDECPRRRGK